MNWFERKNKFLKSGGKHEYSSTIGEKTTSRTRPVIAEALSLVLVLCLIATPVVGASQWHPASEVWSETFANSSYIFPGNLSVTSNFTVDNGTLFIDSALNRVGIGTTSPGSKLTVLNGDIALREDDDGNDALTMYASTASGAIDFKSGGVTKVTIQGNSDSYFNADTGNVGIGTNSPTSPAGVNKFLHIQSGTHAGIVLEDTAGASAWDIFVDGDNLYYKYNDVTKFTFTDDGNLGINDSTPSGLLDIDTGGGADTLVVTSGGNVGIGIANPQNELNVIGTVNATDFRCISAGCINAIELNSDLAGAGLASSSGVLSVNTGNGIVISSDTVVLNQSCSDNQILKWESTGSYWYCTSDVNSGGDLTDVLAGWGITVENSAGPQPRVNLSSSAAGTGLAYSAGVLSVNAGDGLATSGDNVIFDCSDVTGTAGDGIGCSGEDLTVGAGDGLDASTTGLSVDVTDIIGDGLAEDASNNLIFDCSDVSGNGLGCSGEDLLINTGNGIQISSDTVVLNQSCSDNQILKWESTGSYWYCTTDENSGGTISGTGTANRLTYWIGTYTIDDLAAGSSGQFLKSQGTGSAPTWAGITKSDIGSSGTLSFDWADGEVADSLTISGGTINLATNTYSGTLGGDNITDNTIDASEIQSGAITSAGSELDSSVAGNGLALSSGALVVNAGNGLGISSDNVIVNTGNGIQVSSDTVVLNQSCSDNQILKWESTGSYWYCSADSGLTSESDTLQTVTTRGATTVDAVTLDSDGNQQTSIGGNLTVDSGTLLVDAGNNRVGIGTSSPQATLDVNGNISMPNGFYIGGGSPDASGTYAIAIGYNAEATTTYATAIGRDSDAKGSSTTALGGYSEASQTEATALGYYAKATTISSTAVGAYANASGTSATAVGRNTKATGDYAVALGQGSKANGTESTALGFNAEATANYATAVGTSADATALDTTAFGYSAEASGSEATALGDFAKANGTSSTAVGRSSEATSPGATALGHGADAKANYATAIGYQADATNYYTIGVGYYANATGDKAISIGYYSDATSDNTMAIGYQAQATAMYTTALGNNAGATATSATALGNSATASTNYATAMGENSDASGSQATAVGSIAKATNTAAIALGRNANATAQYSIAIGYDSDAIHDSSIALGRGATTTATNQFMIGSDSYPLNTTFKGNVGIGTTTPSEKLDIAGGLRFTADGDTVSAGEGHIIKKQSNQLQFFSGSDGYTFYNEGASSDLLRIENGGNVGIGTTTPGNLLHVEGTKTDYLLKIYNKDTSTSSHGLYIRTDQNAGNRPFTIDEGATADLFYITGAGTVAGKYGTYHTSSDIRLKKNIATLEGALDKILTMRGVTFRWKDPTRDDGTKLGLIAQEVKEVLPEAVHIARDGTKAIEYDQLDGVYVEAIKELNEKVTALEAENSALQARVAGFDSYINASKTGIGTMTAEGNQTAKISELEERLNNVEAELAVLKSMLQQVNGSVVINLGLE